MNIQLQLHDIKETMLDDDIALISKHPDNNKLYVWYKNESYWSDPFQYVNKNVRNADYQKLRTIINKRRNIT